MWQLVTTSCGHNRRNDKFLFYYSFKHIKAARAVRNRYAEHFCPQTWQHGSDNVLNRYCSYSGNIHVVILNEIVF